MTQENASVLYIITRDPEHTYPIKLMNPKRLWVKRAHAETHQEGRTAELVSHIDQQDLIIQTLWYHLRDVTRCIEKTFYIDTTMSMRHEIEEAKQVMANVCSLYERANDE